MMVSMNSLSGLRVSTCKVLLIHDVKYHYIEYLSDKYTLTFDDGLYSVYYYKDALKRINTDKIVFIPTERILLDRKSFPIFIDCYRANNLWLYYGDNSAYMTIDEVKDLHNMGFIIGCHSHYHSREYRSKSSIREDVNLATQWFKKYLGFTPEYFAFPYNNESELLRYELMKCGVKYFYGTERIPIEKILPLLP